MPNYVSNIVEFHGDPLSVQNMLIAVKNDRYGLGTIDFNKLIPMPESLNIEAGSRTDRGLRAYREFIAEYKHGDEELDLTDIPQEAEDAYRANLPEDRKVGDDEWDLGRQAFQNCLRYGAPTWYEWAVGSWNTKWNACGYEIGMDYGTNCKALWFETAWSPPIPVIGELARRFPELEFTHRWADEDIGQNCGRMEYENGERVEAYIPVGNRESVDFALDVWGADPEDYGLHLNEDGTEYVYDYDGASASEANSMGGI